MISPAFQFYPRDYLSSQKVSCMTLEEKGAYVNLLCHDWLNDGIPEDDEKLSKLSGLHEKWNRGGYNLVKECFMPHPSKIGFLTNPRLQLERQKQEEWREKSSEGGKKGAEKRWGKDTYNKNRGGHKMVKECLWDSHNQNMALHTASASTDNSSSSGFPSDVAQKLVKDMATKAVASCSTQKMPSFDEFLKEGQRLRMPDSDTLDIFDRIVKGKVVLKAGWKKYLNGCAARYHAEQL